MNKILLSATALYLCIDSSQFFLALHMDLGLFFDMGVGVVSDVPACSVLLIVSNVVFVNGK